MGGGGFRDLVRKHNELVEATTALDKAHAETRHVLVQLIEAHNRFVSLTFWQRVRWLLHGKTPKFEGPK